MTPAAAHLLPPSALRFAGLQQLARRCAGVLRVPLAAVATVDPVGGVHLLPNDDLLLTEQLRSRFLLAVSDAANAASLCVTDEQPAIRHEDVVVVPFVSAGSRTFIVFQAAHAPTDLETRLLQELCSTAARELDGSRPPAPPGGAAFPDSGRNAAEAAALHYLSALKATLEATTDGILVTGTTGRIISHNRRFCLAWSLPVETLPHDCSEEMWAGVARCLVQQERVAAWLCLLADDPLIALREQVELRDGTFMEVISDSHCVSDGAIHRVWSFRDVTDRVRAEAALRRSEEHFRTLIETAADIVFASDVSGTFVYISPSVERVLGFRPEELCGTSVFALVHPDDRAAAAAAYIDEHSRPGTTLELRLRILTRHGGWKVLHLLSQTRTDERQQPVAVVTARDVTELERAQAALQATYETLQATLEAMPVALIAVDRDSRVRIWNRAAERIFGWTAEEVLHRPNPTVSDADRPAHQALVSTSLAGSAVEGVPIVRQRRDGSSVDLELWTAPVHTSAGPPEISIGILVDVTERKQVQDTLRRNEQRFRALIENALDVIVLLNADGSIRFGSPSGERVLGYSRRQLKGRSILDLAHPDDEPIVRELMHKARRNQTDTMIEVRLRHSDGSYRLLEGLARILVDDDGDTGFVVNARDITARRDLEAQLRQAQKMEAIGQLAGGVAHDFNNMLTAIKGFAMLLEADSGEPADRALYVHEIARAADRAASLTQQLLAFSRRQIMKPAVLDLNHTVREMQGMLQRLLGPTIPLCLDLPADTAAILADPTQIEQVILNLAVNARDAMPGGGELRIVTSNVAAGPEASRDNGLRVAPGDYVVLSVSDTGCGVDDATMARMFEPFYTTKEVGRGTGLGLSTVYGIVSQSGGQIAVNSVLGHGTRFDVWLPAAHDRPHAPAPLQNRTTRPPSAGTVLLVDDETSVRLVTRKMLERAGYHVIDAVSGDDALARLADRAASCDVLISDVVMPGVGGPELAARLLRHNPLLRVILMSGYADDEALPTDRMTVPYVFLAKPFSPDRLQETVQAVLADRRATNGNPEAAPC